MVSTFLEVALLCLYVLTVKYYCNSTARVSSRSPQLNFVMPLLTGTACSTAETSVRVLRWERWMTQRKKNYLDHVLAERLLQEQLVRQTSVS